MFGRVLLLSVAIAVLFGCSRSLAGTYVKTSSDGTLTLELTNSGFVLRNSNNSETYSGSYSLSRVPNGTADLITLQIEKRSGKELEPREFIKSPPMMIKDGGQILEEEGGQQFRKQ